MKLQFFLFFVWILYKNVYSTHLTKFKNNILRLYIYSTPKQIRKGVLKKMHGFINKTNENVYFLLMDVNSQYYSLSEEDRTLLETIISLSL